MVKKLGLAVVLLVALFVAAGVVMAQEEAKTEIAAATAATPVVEAPVVEAPVNVGNVVCPVTGVAIVEVGKDTVEYQGKVYNMCSPMCKEKFLAEPDKYIAIVDKELADTKAAEAVPAEAK
jgi:YHS domain-containing protein